MSGGGAWTAAAAGVTSRDGRVTQWPVDGPDPLRPGTYRLVYDTGSYFAELGIATCHPEMVIVFVVSEPDRSYHVEVMASAAGYGTYCTNE